MKHMNVRGLLCACLLLASSLARADLGNCTGVYVGRIWVEQGSSSLKGVVLLNHPSDTSGSYWVYFPGWTADELKAALTLLTTAKLSGHRVDVITTETNQCGVTSGGTDMKAVLLSTNP